MNTYVETALRIAIIAACVYVSVNATIDFYSTMKEFADMPMYPDSPLDPTASDYRQRMWIGFGIHIAASAVAICAAGGHAIKVWLIALLPFHAIPFLLIFMLSLSLLGILGGSVFVFANWEMLLTIFGALAGTAGLGFFLAMTVEVDADDRDTRRRRDRHDARWRN